MAAGLDFCRRHYPECNLCELFQSTLREASNAFRLATSPSSGVRKREATHRRRVTHLIYLGG
jgi:hypothetical protein